MPRIARPHSPDAIAARHEIQVFLSRSRMSVNQLAIKAKTCQSTLQRFLAGRTKTITESVRLVLNYVHNESDELCIFSPDDAVDQTAEKDLLSALRESWDGRAETATVLAQIIRVLGPALSSHIRERSR